MSFSFGASTSAPFGASATPAFGSQASAPGFSFGGSSAPAFGASTPALGGAAAAAPAFGATSAPLFGAPASAPATGGGFSFAQSSAAFGASTSAPAFGTTPAPFSFGGSTGSLVPAASSAPSFGGFGSLQAAAAAGGPLGQPGAPAAPQPITLQTKFEDLPAQTQRVLTQVQDQVSQYEKDRLAVGALDHLLQQQPQDDIVQEVQALMGEGRAAQAYLQGVKEAMADFVVRAQRLAETNQTITRTYARSKAWRDAPALYSKTGAGPDAATQELLSQPVLLPSPFLEEAVRGFREKVMEYKKVMADLEQAFALSRANEPVDLNFLQSVPTILGNLHDFFVHVAAKVEKQHEQLQRLKTAYLAARQARGEFGDPFEWLRRQQLALQAAGSSSSSTGGAGAAGKAAAAVAGLGSLGAGQRFGSGFGAGGATAGALVPVAGGMPSPAAAGGGSGSPYFAGSPGRLGGGVGTLPFGSPFPSTPGFSLTPPAADGGLGRTPSSKQTQRKGRGRS